MQFTIRHHTDSVAILQVRGALTRTSILVELKQLCGGLAERGNRAVLIDLAECSRANMAGLAVLVELACSISNMHLAFCGLKESVLRKLANTGLDRGLHIHKDAEQAMRSKTFRRVALSHTQAVILCNGDKQQMSPISNDLPVPMLDVLGRSILERIVGHLHAFGIQNIITNPGHLGHKICQHFGKLRTPLPPIRFANEGAMNGGQWIGKPIGTAGSLKKIQQQQSAFDDDFLVLRGDTLTNVDLTELLAHHKSNRADVTIAVPANARATDVSNHDVKCRIRRQRKLNSEREAVARPDAVAYVFSPKVLELAGIKPDWDISQDLLPVLSAMKRPISIYRSDFCNFEVCSPQAYANMLLQGAQGQIPILQPSFPQTGTIWQSADAEVSPAAHIAGSAVIGAGAKIASDVELHGTCVIGAGAQLAGPSILEDCVVFAGTEIAPGFWAQNMTLHNRWAYDHRFDHHTTPTLSFAAKNATETPLDRASIRRSA